MLLPHEFKLPETESCVVVWERNGKRSRQLIKTPSTCKGLQQIMLAIYHVGYSEIKYIESVDPKALINAFGANWGRA
jgi:hypothetical protein